MSLNNLARISMIFFIFIGILNQPYEYYEFLRIFVFFTSIYLVIKSVRKELKGGFEYLYIGLAILFNPLFPIYVSKDTWALFDLASVILLAISLALDKSTASERNIH